MFRSLMLLFFTAVLSATAQAETKPVPFKHTVGDPSAPIRVDEYYALTCSHCGTFYSKTYPELEKRYIDTGKVYFVAHDFPLNALSLKAASVANCMPADAYFPYIKSILNALLAGVTDLNDFENKMYQYASLGGLPLEKAKECANDEKIQSVLVAGRTEAIKKYDVEATPTFVINDGKKIITGDPGVKAFVEVFDRLLAEKSESIKGASKK